MVQLSVDGIRDLEIQQIPAKVEKVLALALEFETSKQVSRIHFLIKHFPHHKSSIPPNQDKQQTKIRTYTGVVQFL